MFTLIRRIRQFLYRQPSLDKQSLGYLLLREDDHLLKDIGLTRDEAETLMLEDETAAPPRSTKMRRVECN